MDRRRLILTALFLPLAVSGALGPGVARAKQAMVYTGKPPGVGASGYDVVAYFTAGKATKGLPAHVAVHDGITYRFASAANRGTFLRSPARYLPQYGGYCAYAVSQGATASSDPNAWTVVGDKLYLNYSKSVRSLWRQDVEGNIAKAERNWPGVLK